MACRWHKGQEALLIAEDGTGWPGCPECDRLLETLDCVGCGGTFLDYGAETCDGVVAAPAASSSGDLCCIACLPRVEAAFREIEDDPS